jgi:hypothetical protein
VVVRYQQGAVRQFDENQTAAIGPAVVPVESDQDRDQKEVLKGFQKKAMGVSRLMPFESG